MITIHAPFDRIDSLVKEWAENVLDTCDNFDDVYSHRLEQVENAPRSGFIPYTAGGYDGVLDASMAQAFGFCAVPKAIQPYLDQEMKEIEEEWDKQNPEHPCAWLFAADEEEEGQLTLLEPSTERDHWREAYYEFETDYLSEGGTYFYKVRALYHENGGCGFETQSESGEPEVLFCVGINTDFEYGRDHISWLRAYGGDPQCTKWAWARTVKVADLTPEMIATFEREAVEALRDA